jgi:hypothetical protein
MEDVPFVIRECADEGLKVRAMDVWTRGTDEQRMEVIRECMAFQQTKLNADRLAAKRKLHAQWMEWLASNWSIT